MPGKNYEKPELLAPAGSIETFFAALEQGADAVYVGTERFNARLRAENFSLDDLARMTAYAHGIGRKIYVTLNTLVKEQELPDLVDTLDGFRRIGPDALIVQDLGIYRAARQLDPEMPLHASTQMTIHNLDGALQAQRMGFERAILARELTLKEIGAIRRSSEIELETFVHGAMCYSISGQCNFSSYAHGKSANRGRCLQPCRRLFDADNKRLPIFAPLDLNAAPILSRLIAAGISSFKIEGRLKPAETIAQTVAAYRLLIDAHPAITKDVVAEAKRRLRLAIGRKQSTGFYLSATPEDSMIGEGMSRSGIYLGKVTVTYGSSFRIETRETVKVGDRLNVQKGIHEAPRGFRVKKMSVNGEPVKRNRANEAVTITAPFDVKVGSAIVKVIDADAVTKEARQHGSKKWPQAKARAKAAFPASFYQDANGAVVLEAGVDGKSFRLEQWPSFEKHLPEDEALRILESGSDGSDVRFVVGEVFDFPDGVPMTANELESARERGLYKLSRILDESREGLKKKLGRPLPGKVSAKEQRLVRVSGLAHAGDLLRKPDVSVIIPLKEVASDILTKYKDNKDILASLVLELPPFVFDSEKRREEVISSLKKAAQLGIRRFLISNLGHFNLLRPYFRRKLDIIAGDGLHCMNSAAFEELRELGATSVTFPLEGDRETLESLVQRTGGDAIVAIVYGKIPLFRSRRTHSRDVREATNVVGVREKLSIFRKDGLTHVVPTRDYSTRHLIGTLREMGIKQFLYDTADSRHSARSIQKALTDVRKPNRDSETSMNFEKELD
ncbi:U32 family peptidase [Candidatus Hydrogenedentota bacterium]